MHATRTCTHARVHTHMHTLTCPQHTHGCAYREHTHTSTHTCPQHTHANTDTAHTHGHTYSTHMHTDTTHMPTAHAHVCAHMHAHKHTAHTDPCTHAQAHTLTHMHIHTHMPTANTCPCTHTHSHTHSLVHIHMCAHSHQHSHIIHTYMHAHLYSHTTTLSPPSQPSHSSTAPGLDYSSQTRAGSPSLLFLTQTTFPPQVLRTCRSQQINTGHFCPLEKFLRVGSSERGKGELKYTRNIKLIKASQMVGSLSARTPGESSQRDSGPQNEGPVTWPWGDFCASPFLTLH